MIYLRGFRTLRFLRSEFGDLSRDQIVNGRICGDISVSLAFGDMRFKTKKNDLEAVNFVRNQLQQHRDVQDRRSRDNISIVIADLGRTDWQSLPRQKENFVYELGQDFATIEQSGKNIIATFNQSKAWKFSKQYFGNPFTNYNEDENFKSEQGRGSSNDLANPVVQESSNYPNYQSYMKKAPRSRW
ncbi:unnamed protein product [Camellia sinensis]